MNFMNNIVLILLIFISLIAILYYYRKVMADGVMKGRKLIEKISGENKISRLPELFTLGLGVLIGWLLIGMAI